MFDCHLSGVRREILSEKIFVKYFIAVAYDTKFIDLFESVVIDTSMFRK